MTEMTDMMSLCDSVHRECLALVSDMIETDSRQPEVMTLALATAQVAHTQISLMRLELPRSEETRDPLAQLCRSMGTAIQGHPRFGRRSQLVTLLDLTARTLSRR